MGKLYNSILSGSSGKIGKVVVANVSGTEVLKMRPRKRTATPSTKQLLVQERLKKAYQFILPYKAYAAAFFGMKTGIKSCYNMAMSNLLKAFKLDYVNDVIIPSYNEIEFSKGSLPRPLPTALTAISTSSFQVTWEDNSNGDPDREADFLQILFIAEEEEEPVFFERKATRIDLSVDINIPTFWTNKNIHVWIAFIDKDYLMPSQSVYAGKVTLL